MRLLKRRVKEKAKKNVKKAFHISVLVLILLGVGIPWAGGYIYGKLVGNIVDSKLVFDGSSPIFIEKKAAWGDSNALLTGKWYSSEVNSVNGWEFVQNRVGTGGEQGSTYIGYKITDYRQFKEYNLSKIIVRIDSDVLSNVRCTFVVVKKGGSTVHYSFNYDKNANCYVLYPSESLYINMVECRCAYIYIRADTNCNPSGLSYRSRVEGYSNRIVNMENRARLFLGASGVVMVIAGLFATPWINMDMFERKKRIKRRRK